MRVQYYNLGHALQYYCTTEPRRRWKLRRNHSDAQLRARPARKYV